MSGQPEAPPPGSDKPVHFEKWTWSLGVSAHEAAVILRRDGTERLTIPLTGDQCELLMGHQVTLVGVMSGFPGLVSEPEAQDAAEPPRAEVPAPDPASPQQSTGRDSGPVLPDRVQLGQLVHETRLKVTAERGSRFVLQPWDQRVPDQQELDMRIGEAVAEAVRERIAARMDELAANYPEDVFPPDSDIRDGISGTAMRHAYRNAAREIREMA